MTTGIVLLKTTYQSILFCMVCVDGASVPKLASASARDMTRH